MKRDQEFDTNRCSAGGDGTHGQCQAQQTSQPDSGSMKDQQSGGEGQSLMGHGGMMGSMGTKGGRPSLCAMMTQHVEGRLAFLKAELNITPEQDSVWNDMERLRLLPFATMPRP